MAEIDYDLYTPKIAVVGVGGQGSNLVNRLYANGIKSAHTIAMNTDATRIPTAVLPFAISFSSSIPLVIFPNTENPIYNATTASIIAITNCIIPTIAVPKLNTIYSPHAFKREPIMAKG